MGIDLASCQINQCQLVGDALGLRTRFPCKYHANYLCPGRAMGTQGRHDTSRRQLVIPLKIPALLPPPLLLTLLRLIGSTSAREIGSRQRSGPGGVQAALTQRPVCLLLREGGVRERGKRRERIRKKRESNAYFKLTVYSKRLFPVGKEMTGPWLTALALLLESGGEEEEKSVFNMFYMWN